MKMRVLQTREKLISPRPNMAGTRNESAGGKSIHGPCRPSGHKRQPPSVKTGPPSYHPPHTHIVLLFASETKRLHCSLEISFIIPVTGEKLNLLCNSYDQLKKANDKAKEWRDKEQEWSSKEFQIIGVIAIYQLHLCITSISLLFLHFNDFIAMYTWTHPDRW